MRVVVVVRSCEYQDVMVAGGYGSGFEGFEKMWWLTRSGEEKCRCLAKATALARKLRKRWRYFFSNA
jgi:hypothetical protein